MYLAKLLTKWRKQMCGSRTTEIWHASHGVLEKRLRVKMQNCRMRILILVKECLKMWVDQEFFGFPPHCYIRSVHLPITRAYYVSDAGCGCCFGIVEIRNYSHLSQLPFACANVWTYSNFEQHLVLFRCGIWAVWNQTAVWKSSVEELGVIKMIGNW